jgi:alanine racemase
MIDGKAGQLIGRVSMDMLTVDLSDQPQAGLGSRVEL